METKKVISVVLVTGLLTSTISLSYAEDSNSFTGTTNLPTPTLYSESSHSEMMPSLRVKAGTGVVAPSPVFNLPKIQINKDNVKKNYEAYKIQFADDLKNNNFDNIKKLLEELRAMVRNTSSGSIDKDTTTSTIEKISALELLSKPMKKLDAQSMMKERPQEAGFLQDFIKEDADMTAVKDAMDTMKTKMDALIKDESISVEEKAKLAFQLQSDIIESMKPYIKDSKLEEFSKMISGKFMFLTKAGTKLESNNLNQITKKADLPRLNNLSDKNKALLKKKLDSLPEDKKIPTIEAIIKKIDNQISKTKGIKTIQLLEAVKSYLQDELDSLKGTTSNDSTLIQDLLNDSGTGSTTN